MTKLNTDNLVKAKMNIFIACYMAGGIFMQTIDAASSEMITDLSKEAKYMKNKLKKTKSTVEKLVMPMYKLLNQNGREISASEINLLIDLIYGFTNMGEIDRNRVDKLIAKIKAENHKKLYAENKNVTP